MMCGTTTPECLRSFVNTIANSECLGLDQNDDSKENLVQKAAQEALRESAQTQVQKSATRSLPTVITIPHEGRKYLFYDCVIL